MNVDQLADRVARSMLAAEGTGPAWGIEIEEVRARYVRISMVVRPDMLNGHGIAHGGMIFALADSAFAYVCNGANHASVAAQASIVFLDKVAEGETLIAEGEEVERVLLEVFEVDVPDSVGVFPDDRGRVCSAGCEMGGVRAEAYPGERHELVQLVGAFHDGA